ncbi:MAG: hypothetical protein VKJ06_09345 [Vampirovibrionales bacterium]|nr:hypothetical protein [Vampirovibrionales bacterium]
MPNDKPNQAVEQQSGKQDFLDTHNTENTKALLEAFYANPVGFIKGIIADEAETHLAKVGKDMQESAQLEQAILMLRKHEPDFEKLEPYVLQEAARLIETDEDGVIDPWPVLLDKALASVKKNLKEMIAKEITPEGAQASVPKLPKQMAPAGPRDASSRAQHFTRQQIAQMSLAEFMRHEPAINAALARGEIN